MGFLKAAQLFDFHTHLVFFPEIFVFLFVDVIHFGVIGLEEDGVVVAGFHMVTIDLELSHHKVGDARTTFIVNSIHFKEIVIPFGGTFFRLVFFVFL